MPNENFNIYKLGLSFNLVFIIMDDTDHCKLVIERNFSTFSLKFTFGNEFSVKNNLGSN